MKIQIYPSQQLGSERQCVELLQIGSLAMTKVSAAIMEGFAPKYKVLGLPYIFKNKEHSYKVLDGEIGKKFLLSGENYWLRGLTFYDSGSRSFYTKDRSINTPSDLNGLKIRDRDVYKFDLKGKLFPFSKESDKKIKSLTMR